MKKNYKYLLATFAILSISLSAASAAKADDNQGEDSGRNSLPPGIAKQIQGIDFNSMLRGIGQDRENDNKKFGDQPASLTINPNGNVKLNGANVVAAPAAGATTLQVKAWGLTFNLVLSSGSDLRARGGTIALTDIHTNDDVNIQGNMDTTTGNILVQRLEDMTATSNAQTDQLRNQINALIQRLNELLSRAGYPTIPTPTPAPTSTPTAVVPTLSSLSQTSATAGGTGFTLTLMGTNFTNASVVNWGNTALTTTFVSGNQLTAPVPATNIASAGSVLVSVTNPGTLGGTSNSITFMVQAQAIVPNLSSLSPATTSFGGGAFTLTLNGTNFVSNSVVNWAGTALSTTYISPVQLTATVPAANIATTSTAMVSVTNPGTTGGTSNSLNFMVQ